MTAAIAPEHLALQRLYHWEKSAPERRVFGRPALAAADVGLVHGAVLERLRQEAVRLGVLGEGEQPRDLQVQAVHRPQAHAELRLQAPARARPLVVLAEAAGDRQPARGLVDDHDAAVLVDDSRQRRRQRVGRRSEPAHPFGPRPAAASTTSRKSTRAPTMASHSEAGETSHRSKPTIWRCDSARRSRR